MMKKNCVVLFSHADTSEKERILLESVLKLKKLDLPIILVSHSKIPPEIQDLVDYSLYEKNNLVLKETDFFNEDLPITEANYNTQYFFSGISTRCYVHKKSYGPAVINLYINGFNIAKYLGFDYAILWEYDYQLNEISRERLSEFLVQVNETNTDGFFIPCRIAGVPCVTAVPAIIPVNKFVEYIGHNIIETPKDYIDVTNFQVCEEWIYTFLKTLKNPFILPFEDYLTTFSDLGCNLVSSGAGNAGFGGLNSGVFIHKENKKKWIYSLFNDSSAEIRIRVVLKYRESIILNMEKNFGTRCWYYIPISEEISNQILDFGGDLEVFEEVQCKDEKEIYEYKINRNNIDSVSKGKVFFYYT